jgi:hypothetical protein
VAVTEPRPRSFFRIIGSARPTLADFVSNLQRCAKPRPAEIADPVEWAGLSVFDTRAAAESTARRYPRIGSFVAEVRVPDAAPAAVRAIVLKTGGPGHWLLLRCAEVLLAMAVDARAVGR